MLKYFRKSGDLAVEGNKARQYDAMTRKYRMKELKEYASLAARQLPVGGRVLEIASGPGYFAVELAKLGRYRITGIDISDDLLEIARTNAHREGVDVEFRRANASEIPLPDNAFDFVFCLWALKNFKEPSNVLKETYRLLKPGATALIVDLNRDITDDAWRQYALDSGFKGVTALFMKMAFQIQRSGAYTKNELIEMVRQVPFKSFDIQTTGMNLQTYLSK